MAVPAAGDRFPLEALGAGLVEGVVESVDEVRPMGGLPGMVWRVAVRLPDGALAEAIVTEGAPPAFLDPRYRPATGTGSRGRRGRRPSQKNANSTGTA